MWVAGANRRLPSFLSPLGIIRQTGSRIFHYRSNQDMADPLREKRPTSVTDLGGPLRTSDLSPNNVDL